MQVVRWTIFGDTSAVGHWFLLAQSPFIHPPLVKRLWLPFDQSQPRSGKLGGERPSFIILLARHDQIFTILCGDGETVSAARLRDVETTVDMGDSVACVKSMSRI